MLWSFSKFRGVEWQLEQISYTNRPQDFKWKLISPPSQARSHVGGNVGNDPPISERWTKNFQVNQAFDV